MNPRFGRFDHRVWIPAQVHQGRVSSLLLTAVSAYDLGADL